MALLWVEGFEGYGTSTSADIKTYVGRRYETHDFSSSWYLASGRFGGYCGRANGNYYAGTYSLTTCDTVVFGAAIYIPVSHSLVNDEWFMRLMDGGISGIGCKANNYSGEIDVYRGDTLIASTSGEQTSQNWFYVEVKVKCHATEGEVEVRIDGETRLSLTGINTKVGTNNYHNKVRIYLSYRQYIDDIYILDTTGSVNNNFLGPQKVVGLFPNGDSDTIQWTPSSGETHYNLVDETRDNDDTDYVESSTSGQYDLWDYAALSGIDAVLGLQINTTAERTDATPFTLISSVKSGSTISDDGGRSMTTSYVVACRVLDTDPNTGSAWSVAGVNAMQAGVKVA